MWMYIRSSVWGSDPVPCPLLTLNLSKQCQFGLFFFPRVFYFPLPLQSQCDLSVTLADLGCVGLHISFRPIFCALVSFLLQPSHTALLPAYPQRSFAPWWLSSPSLCISPPNRSANEEHSCSGFHYWTQPIPATIFCI